MGINVIFNQFDYEISERKKEIWDKYNKVIQWGRKHPLRFAEIFLGVQFTDHQKYIFMSTWQAKFIVWLMGRNSGKAATLDTPVYSLGQEGQKILKTIGDLKIGDRILDEFGIPTKVVHLNPVVFEEVFEVEFEDKDIIECNREHLWTVCDLKQTQNEWNTYETEYLYQQFVKQDNSEQHDFVVPDYFSLKRTQSIINIRKTGVKKPMRCITVSNESGLFLCGNHHTVTHNSFLSAPYVMTRSMLIPNHETYIMSVTGPQAQETFKKMESLAMGKIASIANTNTVFLNEIVVLLMIKTLIL